ncbi:MAG: hypothetical protein PVF73_06445 [Bacteroidales bacterium]|jgi:hypothetical protein
MGKILFAILKFFKFFRLLRLRITGKTMADIHSERIVTGRTWEDFCERLKSAGAALLYPEAPGDPFQQAEGVRYLSRLTRAALEAYVEYNNPEFPELRRMVHETVKLGADNPDNYYQNAQINGNYEYRITGKRNTIDYLGFFTQNGNYGTTGGLSPCGVLEDKDLKIGRDGSFEIILSKTKKGENWLRMEEETSLLMVRQTFSDRKNEKPADLTIENLNGQNAPDPVTPEKIDKGLETAALFVAGAPMLFARWAKGFKKHPNRLPVFDPETSNAAGGDANIVYHHSYWKLEEDEALVIEFTPPDCDTWNFQLNNYWMESLDYRYFPVLINKHNAVTGKDGSVKITVSHRIHGFTNWIDTCGHREGTMCLRWYRLKNDADTAEPECKVVKIPDIAKDE